MVKVLVIAGVIAGVAIALAVVGVSVAEVSTLVVSAFKQ